jgi:hypothetical protein
LLESVAAYERTVLFARGSATGLSS